MSTETIDEADRSIGDDAGSEPKSGDVVGESGGGPEQKGEPFRGSGTKRLLH